MLVKGFLVTILTNSLVKKITIDTHVVYDITPGHMKVFNSMSEKNSFERLVHRVINNSRSSTLWCKQTSTKSLLFHVHFSNDSHKFDFSYSLNLSAKYLYSDCFNENCFVTEVFTIRTRLRRHEHIYTTFYATHFEPFNSFVHIFEHLCVFAYSEHSVRWTQYISNKNCWICFTPFASMFKPGADVFGF